MSKYAAMFGAGAKKYSAYRPSYPPELYEMILDFNAAGSSRDLAVDIATGTGQAALDVAKHYKRVIGIDGNDSQIQHAPKADNIEYLVADAHSTGLEPNIADLVTVAQAMHWYVFLESYVSALQVAQWHFTKLNSTAESVQFRLQTLCRFEIEDFYREARRILKPTGTLAAWVYDLPVLVSETHPAQIAHFHIYEKVLGPYWEPRRRLVEQHYVGEFQRNHERRC